MIIFWILVGGLLVLALFFVITPLLKSAPPEDGVKQDALNLEVFRQRLKELDVDLESGVLEQDSYDAARHDLERELLYDVDTEGRSGADDQGAPAVEGARAKLSRWLLAGSLAAIVPVAAVLIYLQLGDPRLADPLQAAAEEQAATQGMAGQSGASLEELVQRLEKRLEENPDNLQGWLMLGRTYFATGKPEKGLEAIEKAYALAPDQAEVKLAYAESLAAASPTKSLEGRPAELIQAVLEQDPQNRIARWLGGMVDFQKGQYASAVETWKKILSELDPNGGEAANLRQMIAEAQTRGGMPVDMNVGAKTAAASAPMPVGGQSSPAPAAGEGASIKVAVTLDPTIAEKAAPDDTVFVFARASAGPPMPLAVQRLQVKDLPKTVTLDDSMAMMPAMRLSAFDQVVVGARVSKSGNAMPQTGDLFGETGPLAAKETDETKVLIDRIKP